MVECQVPNTRHRKQHDRHQREEHRRDERALRRLARQSAPDAPCGFLSSMVARLGVLGCVVEVPHCAPRRNEELEVGSTRGRADGG